MRGSKSPAYPVFRGGAADISCEIKNKKRMVARILFFPLII
jgi:hypothetical protein